MTSVIEVPIDAAPVQRSGPRVEQAAMLRLRTLMLVGVVLSVTTVAAQVGAVPPALRAAVTLAFAMVGPGAAVVATLLLCGAVARDGQTIWFRLSPVVMGALVVPSSVTALVATAQTMLWLGIWRPVAAMVVLAVASAALLAAAAVALLRQGGATGADDDSADVSAGGETADGAAHGDECAADDDADVRRLEPADAAARSSS